MAKLISVNFFAQPSAGKSTSAAFLFAYLKNRGCNLELISEYAKQLTYSRRQAEMGNQIYILAKQYKKMKDIEDYQQVPMIITDSPLPLGLIYSQHLDYYYELEALTYRLFDSFENVNIFVKRVKPYNCSGRNQTEAESDLLGKEINKLINVVFDYRITGDEAGQSFLAEKIYSIYGARLKFSESELPELPPNTYRDANLIV